MIFSNLLAGYQKAAFCVWSPVCYINPCFFLIIFYFMPLIEFFSEKLYKLARHFSVLEHCRVYFN